MDLDHLADLLLAFARKPGNYAAQRGEPAELHAQLDTLAAWALGRVPEGQARRSDELRDAAILFILRACFAPNATHYQVLGLGETDFTAPQLRTRYRAMIRLTHPDMGVAGLPADAGGIVNRAHEVLNDETARRRYDDQLAVQRRPPAPAPAPAPMPAPAQAHAHWDRAAGTGAVHIEYEQGWSARWQSLLARYPGLASKGVTVGGLGLLAFGLLVWVASGPPESRNLIVARGAGDEAGPSPALRATGSQHQPTGPGSMPAERRVATAAPAPTRPSIVEPPRAPTQAPPLPEGWSFWKRDAPPAPPARADSAVPAPDPTAEPPRRVANMDTYAAATRSAAPAPAPQPAPMAPPAPAPEPAPAPRLVAAQSAVKQPAERAPVPTLAPAPTSSPGPAANRVADASAPAPNLAAPQPPPQRAAPAQAGNWPVDASAAKVYLTGVLGTLERPSQAQRTNAYLNEVNVKGSLLQPALPWLRRYPDVTIEHMGWTDSQRAGVMRVQGTVVLGLRGNEREDNRKMSFRLQAEFWGTRDGTVMGSLDLRESE